MTSEEHIRRGERAKELLNEPLLEEAFRGLEEQWTGEWRLTGECDAEQRERLWTRLSVLTDVHAAIRSYISDGEITRSRKKS